VARPPVEVRRACVDDLDDLSMLWSTAREEVVGRGRVPVGLPLEQLRPRLQETLASPDIHTLVARWEGRPAGYALLRVAPALAILDGPALHIDHLFVLPEARRHGVARALLVAATAIAERNGAEQVLAGAPPSARDSHRFLARLGFSPLVVRRAVGTAALRRRLAGEGQRRGLDDLLSRRRSLRARALRGGWPGGSGAEQPEPGQDRPDGEADGEAAGRSEGTASASGPQSSGSAVP
jgi:GNAT superfamily N-acetyltransferase